MTGPQESPVGHPTRERALQFNKAHPERPTNPLPDKPLAACSVADLKGLTPLQLKELLFRATRYADTPEQTGLPERTESSYRVLDDHNYGDGRLINPHETLEGVLAKEVEDLDALGLDFDDITQAVDPIIEGFRDSAKNFISGIETSPATHEGKKFTFHCEGVIDEGGPGEPDKEYYHISDHDPHIGGSTAVWRYNVISLPFKDIKTSTLDHRLWDSSQRGWVLPLSETSLSLYKNRIIEGYMLPHYRISGARVAWALRLGTPEQQAKALELDWQNTTNALKIAEQNKDRKTLNLVTNYAISSFPRDDTYWKEHGFPGYDYDGQQYASLRDLLVDIKARFELISKPRNLVVAPIADIK